MEKEIRILGVLITNREKEAGNVQRLLTKFGCSIKTRLGLHEIATDLCSPCGLILLELLGDTAEMDKLEKELGQLSGVQLKKMVFRH
ncbi:MAG: hypothetical protein EA408_09875 [Marinilabiliales bacterium]|nr:MAG: hypothetical protein EA408_09875 [Marinilabiliales bacterium]